MVVNGKFNDKKKKKPGTDTFGGGVWGVLTEIGLKTIFLRMLISFFALYLLYVLFLWIDQKTYVWQSTTMGQLLRPPRRKSCDLSQASPVFNLTAHRLAQSTTHKYKVGLLMVYDDTGDGAWNEKLMKKVIANRKTYCQLQGCEVVLANDVLDSSRPPAWSKIRGAQKYLQSFEYLFYVDMDVVLMNMDISVHRIIASFASNNTDFIMTGDWNGPNTGVWLLRNSPWSVWFLQTAWEQGASFLGKTASNGRALPFEYEQRVFHYLLNSQVWRDRKLPPYGGDSQSIRSHFTFLPQCAFNSYSVHSFYWKGDRESSQYVDGDFLIHFAGKKGQKKIDLMNHYLALATQQRERKV